jgi:hypothetical protein
MSNLDCKPTKLVLNAEANHIGGVLNLDFLCLMALSDDGKVCGKLEIYPSGSKALHNAIVHTEDVKGAILAFIDGNFENGRVEEVLTYSINLAVVQRLLLKFAILRGVEVKTMIPNAFGITSALAA